MKIIGSKKNIEEFEKYVNKKDFGTILPTSLVLHHTWKPTVESWDGFQTIQALKRFYEKKGWTAAPHLFIAPDGIWLFTDMFDVGIHAGAGNATYVAGRLVGYSIGIEVVGNYDNKKWDGIIKKQALGVISILKKKLNINNKDVKFHREFSQKTCPGKAITKDWVFEELREYESDESSDVEKKLNQAIKLLQDVKETLGDNA